MNTHSDQRKREHWGSFPSPFPMAAFFSLSMESSTKWICGLGLLAYPGLSPLNSNGLIFLAFSWTLATSLCLFCIYKILTVPKKAQNDFPNEIAAEASEGK